MRTAVTLALALASLVACAKSDTQPKKPAAEDPAETARRERAEKALTRIPAVKEKLSAIRGLAFKDDVPAKYQTTADFKEFVTRQVNEELPPDKAKAIASAMLHIGFLTDPIDLAKTMSDAVVTQAGAYYDPKQKKFFVVMVPDDQQLDMISAHELTHALQDQYFGLDPYLEPKTELDEDRANARKFIVEGEATLTMFVFAGQTMGGGVDMLSDKGRPLLKMGLSMAANMSLEDFKAQSRQVTAGAAVVSDDIQKALDAMDTIPPVILVPMMDSYIKGAVAVLAAYDHGGWADVAALYVNAPDSTEQLLHPDTKLYPTRDTPETITLAALPAGYTEVYGNTIGELEWRVYFMLWLDKTADGKTDTKLIEKDADGWDGDRFSVVKAADGTLVGLIATVWDSPEEATEFATAYQATVKKRFPKDERKVWVKTEGPSVFIVDGGTDATLIDTLAKGTKIK